jgi:hypothetical protein
MTTTPQCRWLRWTLIVVGLALIVIYAAGWWFMDVIPEHDRPPARRSTR